VLQVVTNVFKEHASKASSSKISVNSYDIIRFHISNSKFRMETTASSFTLVTSCQTTTQIFTVVKILTSHTAYLGSSSLTVLASSADSRPHRGVRTSSQSRVIRLLKMCTVTAEDPETAGSLAVTDWQVSGQGTQLIRLVAASATERKNRIPSTLQRLLVLRNIYTRRTTCVAYLRPINYCMF